MKKLIKNITNMLDMLSIDIYTGDRKKSNLFILSLCAVTTCVVSAVLFIINYLQKCYDASINSILAFAIGLLLFICTDVFKNRTIPKIVIWFACAILLTRTLIDGTNDGFMLLWILVLPTFYMYFMDVRLGIMLACFLEIVMCVVFYSPLFPELDEVYGEMFMSRFPILYFAFLVINFFQMTHYHIGALKNDEHAKALSKAVADERMRIIEVEWEKKKAEYENEAKTQFLEKMSHVIRTPINGISGMNEMIMKESKDSNILEYSRAVNEACDELMEIVENLLDVSKSGLKDDVLPDKEEFIRNAIKHSGEDVIMGQLSDDAEKTLRELAMEGAEKKYIEADLSDISILEVDDNKINLKLIKNYLKNSKCKLVMASTGKQAIELTRKEKFDIILMDHMMPEMDGIECMHRIREDEDNLNRETCIVALTANAVKGIDQKYIKEGFDDYISKPVEYNRFLMKMCEIKAKIKGDGTAEYAIEEDTSDILYIDRADGIHSCMDDEEFYEEIVADFKDQGPDNIEKLKSSFATRDYKAYHVLVHGLKNTAHAIGANNFSELSKKHEFAVKEDRLSFVDENADEYVEIYQKLIDKL